MHADTLFSAILNSHTKLYGQVETNKLVEALAPVGRTRPKIRLSSGFHCLKYGERDYQWFLPKPVHFDACSPAFVKVQKKVSFLSPDVWTQAQQPDQLIDFPALGTTHALSLRELFRLGLLRDAQWMRCLSELGQEKHQVLPISEWKDLPEEELQSFFSPIKLRELVGRFSLTHELTYPKVHAHKVDQEAAYFTQTNLQLATLFGNEQQEIPVHLYFLLDSDLPDTDPRMKRLMAAIRMLAEEGIGGERSTGCGALQAVVEYPFELPDVLSPTHWVSLSLCIPESDAAFAAFELYRLVVRGGGAMKTTSGKSNQRRKIRMIEEGALIRGSASLPISGETVDVSPYQDRSVLRYGNVIALPIRYEQSISGLDSQAQTDSDQSSPHRSWKEILSFAIRRLFR